ncbi:hypothetical protein, partial [uncultured Pyramidobacter sp.]|uniref:hypothetical protein n=1 Tax=uncultured Pyramidobacter sp. TaxID=1623495 RepID=UPI00258BCE42
YCDSLRGRVGPRPCLCFFLPSSSFFFFFTSSFFSFFLPFSAQKSSLKNLRSKIAGPLRKILPAAGRPFYKLCSLFGLVMFLLSSLAFFRPLERKIDLRASQMRILKRQSRNYSTIFNDIRYHFVPLIALLSAF